MKGSDRRSFLRRGAGGVLGVLGTGTLTPLEVLAGELGKLSGAPASDPHASTHSIQPVGIQLYTLRSLLSDDVPGTLRAVAEIGYREIEFAGLYGTPATGMRALLDGLGLDAVSNHISIDRIRESPGEVLDESEVLGLQFVTVPSLGGRDRGSLDGFRRVADDFNAFAEVARGRGVGFAYHNHDFEFEPVEGVVPYELLLERTDPGLVKMQMDVFWAVNGGRDPLALIGAHPGRFTMIHAKDRTADGQMVAVGAGVIDFATIIRTGRASGLAHIFVEHDRPADPLASVRASYASLAAMEG